MNLTEMFPNDFHQRYVCNILKNIIGNVPEFSLTFFNTGGLKRTSKKQQQQHQQYQLRLIQHERSNMKETSNINSISDDWFNIKEESNVNSIIYDWFNIKEEKWKKQATPATTVMIDSTWKKQTTTDHLRMENWIQLRQLEGQD